MKKKWIKQYILLGVLLFSHFQAFANKETEKALFITAEKAIKASKYNSNQFKHHLMRPYLDYENLSGRLNNSTNRDIDLFLKKYKKTPYARLIKHQWFDHRVKHKAWKDVIRYYSYGNSVRRKCNYLQALIKTQYKTKAFKQIPALWTVGKSQPKACDFAFKKWIKAGKLTPKLVWKRIDAAFIHYKLGLVRYLKRYLKAQDQKRLDQMIAIYQNPQQVLSAKWAHIPKYRKIMLMQLAVKRSYYKNPQKALVLWSKLQKKQVFSKQQKGSVDSWLVRRMYDEIDEVTWQFVQKSKPTDDKGKGAKIRAALLRKDWKKVLAWIDTLSSREKNKEIWLYWQARSLEQQGDQHANWYYQKLAQKRDYYGFLAADKLSKPYQFNHKPTPNNPILKAKLAKREGFKRAIFLLELNRDTDARREWNYASRYLSKNELFAATQLATDLNWDFQVIRMLAKAKYWNDVEKRFPIAFLEQVKKQAVKNNLAPAWVYGIIRQESAFNHRANSRVGAAGLMQLMPATARKVAKMLKEPKSKAKKLNDPLINIQFGTKYLAYSYEKLQSHPVLATAGYNAGPHRVTKWLKQRPNMAADLWIELIPYRETRTYVKKVMTYATIYDFFKLKSHKKRLAKRIGTIETEAQLAKAE